MRWKGREQSDQVEDRRGRGPGGKGLAVGGGGIGVLIIALIAVFLGADPKFLLNQVGQMQQAPPAAVNQQAAPGNDEARQFISVVLRDTEKVWDDIFRKELNSRYQKPGLVIYSGSTPTGGCGMGKKEFGPFYCPADRKIYIDPTFFHDLRKRHRAPGDFAQAYVIAHEVAHHVQKLTGFNEKVSLVRAKGNKRDTNRASVRLELQADFLAGVWAHHAQKKFNILEQGDLQEAIRAANQIGDDTLMREAGVAVRPHNFTHGTSAQRVRWFKAGLKSGRFNDYRELFEIPYNQL